VKSSDELAKTITAKFGPTVAYIAVILTSVCLNQEVLLQMRKRAQDHRKTEEFQQGIESAPPTPQPPSTMPISIRAKSASPQKSMQRNSLGPETGKRSNCSIGDSIAMLYHRSYATIWQQNLQ
jgi:hypothetical protein